MFIHNIFCKYNLSEKVFVFGERQKVYYCVENSKKFAHVKNYV